MQCYFHLQQAKVFGAAPWAAFHVTNVSEWLRRVCILVAHHKEGRPTDNVRIPQPCLYKLEKHTLQTTVTSFLLCVRVCVKKKKKEGPWLRMVAPEEHFSCAANPSPGRSAMRLRLKASLSGRKMEATSGLAVTSALDPWHFS